MKRFLAALLAVFFMMTMAAQAEYIGSEPAEEIYVVQSKKHTCTLIAATMLLRNYASQHNFSVEEMTESNVRNKAWNDRGLSWDFTVNNINVQVVHEIKEAQDKKAYLIHFLQYHPEGVVIYDANAPHAIWLFGYDEETDTFYCADTTTDVAGRTIRLEESIIPGKTQEDKIQTIDRIWYVTGTREV